MIITIKTVTTLATASAIDTAEAARSVGYAEERLRFGASRSDNPR